MRLAVILIICSFMPALTRAQARSTAVFPKAVLSLDAIDALVRAGRAVAKDGDARRRSPTYIVRAPGYTLRYDHVGRVPNGLPLSRFVRRPNLYVLTAVIVSRPQPVRIPQVRYETKYVDRIVEKWVSVPVEVERRVFVDRPVIVDRPVVQTIEKPVAHYIEKPVLPGRALVAAVGVLAFLTGIFAYTVGAHVERRRVQKLRLTLPEFDDLTNEARRVADQHITNIHRIAQHRAKSTAAPKE